MPADVCLRASAAIAQFEDLVERHAGDRNSFESMAADLAGEPASASDVRHKRAAFRANGHIWGVQASSILSCTILAPSADGRMIDGASIRG